MPARKSTGSGSSSSKSVTSRANLVDLAGSERYRDAGETPLRQQESISINQSLTTLGLVIGTLASAQGGGGGSAAHVPYRNSKLTHLLKESLGGSALCVMLCTISPSVANLHESLSTLHFASRARAVVNTASRNVAVAAQRDSIGGGSRDKTPKRHGTPENGDPQERGRTGSPRRGGSPRGERQQQQQRADMSKTLSPPPRGTHARRNRPPRPGTANAAAGSGAGSVGGGGDGRASTAPLGRALSDGLGALQHSESGAGALDSPSYASTMGRGGLYDLDGADGFDTVEQPPPPPPIQLPGSPPLAGMGTPASRTHTALRTQHLSTTDLGSQLFSPPSRAPPHSASGSGTGHSGYAPSPGGSTLILDRTMDLSGDGGGRLDIGGGGAFERTATLTSGTFGPSDHLLITNPFEGLDASGGVGAGSWEAQVVQLRERLKQVARAAERSEESRSHQSRVYKVELKRAQEQERDKAGEVERLRWELDQMGERENSRQKVSQLQDEVMRAPAAALFSALISLRAPLASRSFHITLSSPILFFPRPSLLPSPLLPSPLLPFPLAAGSQLQDGFSAQAAVARDDAAARARRPTRQEAT